jgi:SAM-dependent methyltransferase
MKTTKGLFDNDHYVRAYAKEYINPHDISLAVIRNVSGKSVLSLGCGSGREVKELVKNGNKVVAVDFIQKMVDSSKRIEPNAEYYCMDVIDFVKDERFSGYRFDYILGLDSFFNYIEKKHRLELVKGLYNLLNNDGKIIFDVRWWDARWQDAIKCCLYRFISMEFGNIPYAHLYTRGQIIKLLKDFDYNIDRSIVQIFKKANAKFQAKKKKSKDETLYSSVPNIYPKEGEYLKNER